MPNRASRLYAFGPFRLDSIERELTRAGEPLALTPKAVETLLVLVEHHGQVVDRDELMTRVWPDVVVEENNLTQNVSGLRKILGEGTNGCPYIETVPRRGYRFVADVQEVSEEAAEPRLRTSRWIWLAAAPTLIVVGAGVWLYLAGPTAESSMPPMKVVPFTATAEPKAWPAFSPDGNQIAYAWEDATGTHHIATKLLGAETPLRLTSGAGDDHHPVWSPDGRFIAFIRQFGNLGLRTREVLIVPALGGHERKLYTQALPAPSGLDWSPDGKHLVFPDAAESAQPSSLLLLSVETLQTRRLTAPPARHNGDSRPAFSPDGQSVAFVRHSSDGPDVYVVPLAGGEPRRLTHENRRIGGLAWTADGDSIVFSSARTGSSTLWKIRASGGGPERVPGIGDDVSLPAISRQGHRLAFIHGIQDTNIYRLDLLDASSAGEPIKIISSTQYDHFPQISPDGMRIAFESNRSGGFQVWICDRSGANAIPLATSGVTAAGTPMWSPDGERIAFVGSLEGHDSEGIYVTSAEGGMARRLATGARPSWSRDGRWIYFQAYHGGEWQVWKVPVHGGSTLQVTKNGGLRPLESLDGSVLYYWNTNESGAGIWRMPAEGTNEALVLRVSPSTRYDAWALGDRGIYFFNYETAHGPAIEFVDLETYRVRRVAAFERGRLPGPSLAISPNGTWLLYTQSDYRRQDIMVAENFR